MGFCEEKLWAVTPHKRQRISGSSGFQEVPPQFIKFFLRQITDVAMQLSKNIANKCFCLWRWRLHILLKWQLLFTDWHSVVSKRTWIVFNIGVRTSFCTMVMICFSLQCIFIVYKITAVFMCDENSLRCHHALRRKLSPNQFIICGEWWVSRISCTGLASCCLQDCQCHTQTSE